MNDISGKMLENNVLQMVDFFKKAKQDVIQNGFQYEINACDNRYFEFVKPIAFFNEYAYVVLNTGMKNQVAEKMFKRLFTEGIDSIKHKQKRKSINWMQDNYETEFEKLKMMKTDVERLDYLDSLPFIGPITKFHLARNIGIDCAKPDRHLVRLALKFGFLDVHDMCDHIAKRTGERIGTVDVILWRYSNLHGT